MQREHGSEWRSRVGAMLVVLQLGLMAALAALAAPAFIGGNAGAGAWFLALAGAALGSWAVSANRPGNFNIRPTPREGGRLVQEGPYRWIRHPMYSAVIVLGAAAAWATLGWQAWLALAALAAVLAGKAALEERWMLAVHPGYRAYRARTKRFVPGIW